MSERWPTVKAGPALSIVLEHHTPGPAALCYSHEPVGPAGTAESRALARGLPGSGCGVFPWKAARESRGPQQGSGAGPARGRAVRSEGSSWKGSGGSTSHAGRADAGSAPSPLWRLRAAGPGPHGLPAPPDAARGQQVRPISEEWPPLWERGPSESAGVSQAASFKTRGYQGSERRTETQHPAFAGDWREGADASAKSQCAVLSFQGKDRY